MNYRSNDKIASTVSRKKTPGLKTRLAECVLYNTSGSITEYVLYNISGSITEYVLYNISGSITEYVLVTPLSQLLNLSVSCPL